MLAFIGSVVESKLNRPRLRPEQPEQTWMRRLQLPKQLSWSISLTIARLMSGSCLCEGVMMKATKENRVCHSP